ncbi:hypothetical protein BS50DRAFT_594429 [Corynespora cassiicola Philippines]|uniref:Transmembrane protein n=1 Tax=Corynespora cassiicola Philippines TaxID=1448308 RepID=A0A2T2N2Y8_CORCC|nr:hypothetical protein BS50DRAFT_594429 [Corynespora cassiicola Philippines]
MPLQGCNGCNIQELHFGWLDGWKQDEMWIMEKMMQWLNRKSLEQFKSYNFYDSSIPAFSVMARGWTLAAKRNNEADRKPPSRPPVMVYPTATTTYLVRNPFQKYALESNFDFTSRIPVIMLCRMIAGVWFMISFFGVHGVNEEHDTVGE